MQSAQSGIVRKSEFARMRGVTPARVSQWISSGKIFGDAVVGSGSSQRINAEIAGQQLGATLDLAQMTAQPPRSDAPAAVIVPEALRRAQDAKAEQAEIDVRRARRKESEELGVYMRVDAAKRAWAAGLAELLASLEECVPQMGDALAAECGVDAKAATVILRRELHAWRERQVNAAKEIVAVEPQLVEDDA